MKILKFEDLIKKRVKSLNLAIENVVKVSFDGLFNPKQYKDEVSSLKNLKRTPFPRQARLICASMKHLNEKNSLIISAEMGTGKTISGIAIAYLTYLKKQKTMKTFIMSPTHLVSKWAAEIEKTLGKGPEAIIPYEICIVRKHTDLKGYKNQILQNKLYFFILSKESAKLSYPRRTAFNKRKVLIEEEGKLKHSFINRCPDCFDIIDDEKTRKCPNCNAIMRQVDKNKPSNKRISIAEYIKRFPKGWIDLLLLDEIHELKGGNTAQGNAFGTIASYSKKCVGLTGTLLNGYASSLFYILYRLNPNLMKNTLKLEFTDVKRFVELYGAKEESFESGEINEEGVMSRKGKLIYVRELPKINPALLNLLLSSTIFLKLDEMNIKLPKYEEKVEFVEPNIEWLGDYQKYISNLNSEVMLNKKVLGALANDSISLCDLPFLHYSSEYAKASYIPKEEVLDKTFISNKEKRLINLLKEELSNNRKCLIYATYTNLGVSQRLQDILEIYLPNFKVSTLKASINASKREKWIEDNQSDILICNPELVKTGLDLLEYPTIIFYQTTYNVFTLKQAARRSWRIGQTKDVKVFFMAYKKTAQQSALSLISKKIVASNSLEGRLSLGNDLASLEEDNASIQAQLAKSIAKGIKDEEVETNYWEFQKRNWDEFEKFYIDLKSSNVKISNKINKEMNITDIYNNENKITIYKREFINGRIVTSTIFATKDDIQSMVENKSENSMLQLSLF